MTGTQVRHWHRARRANECTRSPTGHLGHTQATYRPPGPYPGPHTGPHPGENRLAFRIRLTIRLSYYPSTVTQNSYLILDENQIRENLNYEREGYCPSPLRWRLGAYRNSAQLWDPKRSPGGAPSTAESVQSSRGVPRACGQAQVVSCHLAGVLGSQENELSRPPLA